MYKRDYFRLSHSTTEFLAIALISLSLMGPALAESPAVDLPDASAESGPIVEEESGDLSTMLPFLITSPDRKHLATQLLSALERGDLKQAENSLNAAIEAGTLAIALIDRIHDPALRPTLEGLGLRGSEQPDTTSTQCSVPAQPAAADLSKMQEALNQEKVHSSTISRALAEITERYDALQKAGEMNIAAKAQEASKLEKLLQQERERSAGIERELTRAREDARNLQGLRDQEAEAATYIAELEEALAQAQARGDGFAHKIAELTQSLQQAQERNASLTMTTLVPLKAEAITTVSSTEASIVSMKAEPAAEAATPALPAKGSAEAATSQRPGTPAPLSTVRLPPVEPPASTNAVPVPAPNASMPPQEAKAEDRLTARANELLRSGDVSGARLLLERSLKSGNPRAAFLFAETFDPHVLAKLGVRGIRGDVAKARDYYAQAQALGLTQASERLEALK